MRSSEIKVWLLGILFPLVMISCKSKIGFLHRKKITPTPVTIQPVKKAGELKSFDELIHAKSSRDSGLFNIYFSGGRYYYEIPDSLLQREMLAVTRYVKTPTKDGIYGGEETNEQVWVWEKHGKQIFIRVPSYRNIAAKESDMYESVQNSNFSAILASFDIKAVSKDKKGVLIDVTDFFSKDVPAIGLPQALKNSYRVQRLDESRSYIDSIKSFPINIEAKTIKTYLAQNAPEDPSIGSVSIAFNTSMVLLPKEPMRARIFDSRVGFFAQTQTDYGLDEQKAALTRYVKRWRLEPKDEAAYLRGELVEPKKQIVYYIDPATPEKWRPYLIEGVKDWNVAFEKAGFKNAITCIEAPENDPDWSPEDARYSVIRYFASNIPNAYGPHVTDPRSGEIIESDIGWYHNVMSLVRNWFFVQTAAINPDARHARLSDEVMGQLIRFVSSHEIGHTLGLAHNFGSSYAYPVDSLRSPSFTRKMGGTAPSIMDYARFNYIAQPGDGEVRLYPGIGPYDKWAIQWGYSWMDNKSASEEFNVLNKWTLEKAADPVYFYGRQTAMPVDPRSQSEDLGNDAIKASAYGIENLKRIIPHIQTWTYQEGKTYEDLGQIYQEVLTQFSRYMGHVKANIGGIYENPKTYEQSGAVYTPVSKDKQKAAVKFICEQAFQTPWWLINKDELAKFDDGSFNNRISNFQSSLLSSILDPVRLTRVINNATLHGSLAYSIDELFADLQNHIFSEVKSGQNIDAYRRALQNAYIERLGVLLKLENRASDMPSIARQQLSVLKRQLQQAIPRYRHVILKAHLNNASERIVQILYPR